jgi:hypothetical protein
MRPQNISGKPLVIERVFAELFDPTTGELRRAVVTNEDLVAAINWCRLNKGSTLSSKNPANFFKDIIRGNADAKWPESLKALRWTAKQKTGDGNVFEFVRYRDDQNEPFPDSFTYHEGVKNHRIQTLSIPLATKALGRDDETYLIQVAAKIHVIETHFALESPVKILEINHLQIGIKQRKTEIDSLYSASYQSDDGSTKRLLITAEAKNKGQRILVEQILNQVSAAFTLATDVDIVIPVAMIARPGGIYLVEFQKISRTDHADNILLVLEREAFYELMPRVPGI